ncbi:MAG TPA: hypothetical protein VHY82_14170, partial [Acetobacteraceae bacterium]|nr:hypothetical protein [Acetobacteraceae bacterium]
HLPEWRQQYPHLASVDMRYEDQVVLDMKKDMTKQASGESVQDAVSTSPTQHHPAAGKHPAGKPAAKSTKAGKTKG